SSRGKPRLTPSTMLATSGLVRPCRDRCGAESVGRATTMTPSVISMCMAAGSTRSSVPRAPVTLRWLWSRDTSTPLGMGTGSRPILDMRSPHVRHDFAAQTGTLGGAARHQPMRGRDDCDAQPTEHPRQFRLAGIHTKAGL